MPELCRVGLLCSQTLQAAPDPVALFAKFPFAVALGVPELYSPQHGAAFDGSLACRSQLNYELFIDFENVSETRAMGKPCS